MEQRIKSTCESCNYFIQHYMFWRGKYRRIGYGHCCHEKHCRQCRIDKKACAEWIPQTDLYKQEHTPPV